MHTRFRRFLLMFLVLALPMQAWASASMLGCALGQQQAQRIVAEHAEHAERCHEADSDAPVPEQHDCQHCSACMLGATLPPPTAEVAIGVALAERYAPDADAAFAAFIPDGPERPPRNLLA